MKNASVKVKQDILQSVGGNDMKKKVVCLMITVIALVGSFEIGRQTQMNTTGEKVVETMPNGVDLADDTQYSYIDKFIGSITDWNTDGKELAIMTSAGYELYAQKQDDVYRESIKQYIALDDVVTWNVNGDTLTVSTSDGNNYTFDK